MRCTDVNRLGQVRPETLFDYFQEAANVHAQLLGCGFDVLSAKGQAWVLSKIRLDVERTSKLGDTLKVHTWPSGFKRLYALREACFTDDSGEVARLTSYWVLLDMAGMRPVRLPEGLAIEFPDNSDMPQYFDLNGRIVAESLCNPMTLTVPEHFIDINGHMNNARYSSLVGDWLARELGHPAEIVSLTGHFLHATAAWETLEVSGELHAEGGFVVRIAAMDGDVRFLAAGTVK